MFVQKVSGQRANRRSRNRRSVDRRSGSATIETALVMIPLIMFFFAIFEYGRFTMDLNVLNNAVREGCRSAVVNNMTSTVSTDVTNIVKQRLGTRLANFSGLTVAVSGKHQGAAANVDTLVPGDLVTVTVTGSYSFLKVIPLVPVPSSYSIDCAVTMVCEGGT